MITRSHIEIVYSTYVDDLFSYALHLGFGKETIMDAIHDIFCKLCADNRTLEDIADVKSYLFRSLKNKLIDFSKGAREHEALENHDEAKMPFLITVTIEDDYIEKEDCEKLKTEIETMFQSLTDRQREIIYLRYMQEYSYADIAEMMNITIPTCRKLMHKTMQHLKEKYAFGVLLFLWI